MKKYIYVILKIIIILFALIILIFGIGFVYCRRNINFYVTQNNIDVDKNKEENIIDSNIKVENKLANKTNIEILSKEAERIAEINDWRLLLVNSDNPLPENFVVELAKINGSREFDARAVNELVEMLQDMKKAGASNIWIQSAYRTPEYQEKLYQRKVQYFITTGKSQQDAEMLASRWVNKPKRSEHNSGLAVDFNNVKRDFEDTKEFAWLVKNAENYGFILRYKKEKQSITKVNYEPWHWRYVGVEHAKEINKQDMCLEEYIEYIRHEKEY